MSTRTAKDDSVFHQCRYASAPEFERGLIANLVAKRCAVLDAPADRELIWFMQYLSHQEGGLAAVAVDLIARFSNRLGSAAMVATGKTGGDYIAAEISKIRLEMPADLAGQFPLFGEMNADAITEAKYLGRLAANAKAKLEFDDDCIPHSETIAAKKIIQQAKDAVLNLAAAESLAEKHPKTYPVKALLDVCHDAAQRGGSLEKELCDLCLKPSRELAGPWYFADLVNVLREYQQQWSTEKSKEVNTAVVRKVHETIDYTVQAGILSLLTGSGSLGQSFAARQWCEAHPGQARICDVPPSNDEASFYRAIARAVGLGNFLNYKNVQIRERVEFVLQTGGICLVLNHAENLWPQKNLREAFPGRLAWLFDQVAKGASACMIAGPQFFMQQRTCEKTGWHSPEFRKKINHLDRLPDSLSVEDVTAIARAMLPEAGAKYQAAVAIYAVGQQRDLAALEAISKRAQFLAQRAGRAERTAEDVVAALKFVSGSDQLLRESFNPTPKTAGRPRQMVSADPGISEPLPAAARSMSPTPQSFGRRSTTPESVEA